MIERVCLYLVMAIFAIFLVVFPWPVMGHEFKCFPRNVVERALEKRWGEAIVAQGMMNNNNVVLQVWRSGDGSTFSITFTNPSGRTCLLANGSDYQNILWYLLPGEEATGSDD